jgi:hypothetical protein
MLKTGAAIISVYNGWRKDSAVVIKPVVKHLSPPNFKVVPNQFLSCTKVTGG